KNYPVGEECEYLNDNAYRTTDEEKRHLDNLNSDFLTDYREAAEIHRQVRQWAQKNIKPGQGLTEIAEGIEDGVRALTGHWGLEEGDALKGGMGFPTGLSINHCAAHYTPNLGNKMVLQQEDVMKVDFGVHVNGRIVDSAFTLAFEPKYDNLLTAVREATNAGVKEAGIDVRVGDIGGVIQEVMESYEVEIDGTTYPVKSIRNLNGHTIERWSIHGAKSVPIVKSNDTTKMEEGDVADDVLGLAKVDLLQQVAHLELHVLDEAANVGNVALVALDGELLLDLPRHVARQVHGAEGGAARREAQDDGRRELVLRRAAALNGLEDRITGKPHPAVPPGAGPAKDAVRHGAATGQSLTKMSTSR
ncbi:hypothetical protein BN1708_016456, partial [Verticillium longisporum]